MVHKIKNSLCVSIVVYEPYILHLIKTLKSLESAIGFAECRGLLKETKVFVIVNGSLNNRNKVNLSSFLKQFSLDWHLLSGHGNIGYGKGHNLAIQGSCSAYHLVLNPDVEMDPQSLFYGIQHLEKNKNTGLAVPAVMNSEDRENHLCKSYPDILSLFVRGLNLKFLNKLFKIKLRKYELQNLNLGHTIKEIPIASGCFMLFRQSTLEKIGGFNPKFFLYFEDFDICQRLKKNASIDLIPQMKIYHHGGGAAKKGWRHIRYFINSAIIFFNTHGWKWL